MLVALAGADTITAAPVILLVTGAITLFLATPAYLVLRLYRRETWQSCIAAGLLVGAIVAACILLPVSGSVQIGQEMAVLRLLEGGARWSRLGRLPLAVGVSLAVAANWTISAIPSLTMDRSCHNVLRDGRRSISPVLFFTIELTGGEWPRFQDPAERFAAHERWNIDKSDDKDKKFSRCRLVNACTEPGTEIMFDGADIPDSYWVRISVFQPQGGSSWEEPARRLLASIETAFPDRLRRSLFDPAVQSPSILLPQH